MHNPTDPQDFPKDNPLDDQLLEYVECPDPDVLTRRCPACGSVAEWPDCERCGHSLESHPKVRENIDEDYYELDALTTFCPQCGSIVEYPDCERCGYDFTAQEQ